jgi:ribosome biogenesis protein Nip4
MEDTHLRAFVKNFSSHPIDNIEKIGRNNFLATSSLLETKRRINKDTFSIGLFLGETKDRFYPSPAFVDIISRLEDADNRKIFVNKKAEWLFLCGRNILMESIVRNPRSLKEGFVLVQNENDENLGYGIFHQQGKDTVIKNLLDKGKYLRYNEKGRR